MVGGQWKSTAKMVTQMNCDDVNKKVRVKCDRCKEYRADIKDLKKEIMVLQEKVWSMKQLKKCGYCEKSVIGHWPDCDWFIKKRPSVSFGVGSQLDQPRQGDASQSRQGDASQQRA